MPGTAAFAEVIARFVRTTHGDVTVVRKCRRLGAGENPRNVLIHRPSLPGQRPSRSVVRPTLAECHQRPCIEPERAPLIAIRREQFLERRKVIAPQQAASEDVANSLIVVWVQPEHLTEVVNRTVRVAELEEHPRKTGPGSHVGAGFEKTPEVPAYSSKPSGPSACSPAATPLA